MRPRLPYLLEHGNRTNNRVSNLESPIAEYLSKRFRRYISDVGAQGLKPLFITGSVITVVFLDLSFVSERWLRHSGQLVPNKGRFDKFCAIASIFFSIAGALGLILLSVYDTLRHSHLHSGFLAMFL